MSLPSRPDLTRLNHMARVLQRSAVAGDNEALQRIHGFFPGVAPEDVKLSHAQLVLARDHGSASWPALIARVEKRIARTKAAASRAQARVADAETLAERWFALARSENLQGLVAALAVGKARMVAARAVVQRDRTRYDGSSVSCWPALPTGIPAFVSNAPTHLTPSATRVAANH